MCTAVQFFWTTWVLLFYSRRHICCSAFGQVFSDIATKAKKTVGVFLPSFLWYCHRSSKTWRLFVKLPASNLSTFIAFTKSLNPFSKYSSNEHVWLIQILPRKDTPKQPKNRQIDTLKYLGLDKNNQWISCWILNGVHFTLWKAFVVNCQPSTVNCKRHFSAFVVNLSTFWVLALCFNAHLLLWLRGACEYQLGCFFWKSAKWGEGNFQSKKI